MYKNLFINRAQIMVIAVAAIVMGLSVWTFSHAAGTEVSMCVKQSGVSYIIGTGFAKQSCNSNEQLLTFNVQGPEGPQGIQGPIGPQGPEGGSVKVYDSTDRVIGYVVDTTSLNPRVYTTTSHFDMLDKTTGAIESVMMDSSIATPENNVSDSAIYYVSPDCVGQAYHNNGLVDVNSGSEPYLSFSWAFSLGGSGIFAVNRSVPPLSSGLAESFRDNPDADCSNGAFNLTGAIPINDLRSIISSYVPPFHIGL